MDNFITASKPSPCCSKDTSVRYQNTINSSANTGRQTGDNYKKEFKNTNNAGPSQISSSAKRNDKDNDNLDWKVDSPKVGPSRQKKNSCPIPELALDTSGHPDGEWEWSACSDKSPKESSPVTGRESVIVYDERRGTYKFSSKHDDNSRSKTPIPVYGSWNTPNVDWATLPAVGPSRRFEKNPPLPPRTSTLTSGAYSLASSIPLPKNKTDDCLRSYQENPNSSIAESVLREVGELYYENSWAYNNFGNLENSRNLQKPVNFDSLVKNDSGYSASTVQPKPSPSTTVFQPISSTAPSSIIEAGPSHLYNYRSSDYQNSPSNSRAWPPSIHYEQRRATRYAGYKGESPLEINTVIRENRNKVMSESKRLDKYSPLPQRPQQERKKGKGVGKKTKPIMSLSASVSTTLTLQPQINPTAPKTHAFPMTASSPKIDEGSNPKKND